MEQVETIHARCVEAGCTCLPSASMQSYTSFHIGGDADVLLKPKSVKELQWILRTFQGEVPIHFIGRGSNLLVSDEGVDGMVVRLGQDFARVEADGTTLLCEAGAPLAKACYIAAANGLSGLEFAWGIPGSVGGGAYMNAGAYGGEIKDVVAWCEHLDEDGNLFRVPAEKLEYCYRHSFYTGKNLCITRVAFFLKTGEKAAIRARMDELLARRREKQPLEYPSGGSTFKRPAGAYAAALIEQCGLKGLRVGGAMVSEKHSGFVINYDHATCADVKALIREIQEAVREKTGYALECEIGEMGRS